MWLLFGQLLETYGLVFISTTGHTEFGTFKKNYNNLFPKETTFDLVLQMLAVTLSHAIPNWLK